MAIEQMRTEDVIKSSSIKEYNKWLDRIYGQLLTLDMNIFFLKKINKIPIKLFYVTPQDKFFEYFHRNAIEISIITITKLVTDQGIDVMTLRKFRGQMINEMVIKDYIDEFKKLLGEEKWDIRIKKLFDNVKEIRDSICHNLLEPKMISIQYKEIFELADELKKLLNILAFNKDMMTMYPLYYKQSNSSYDKSLDIDIILNIIAERSTLLNLPETNSIHWNEYKKNIGEVERKSYDDYQKKFNLQTQFS